MRDDFDSRTKDTLANRVGARCSNPGCRRSTRGPQQDPAKAVNVGVAAHITAASPGGKRYDANLEPKQRKSISNGIWLCQTCAKLIDDDAQRYPSELLRRWKEDAEKEARSAIQSPATTPRTLNVRISPTRERRRQMAQLHLFNRGPGAIYITAWYASWGEGIGARLIVSVECVRGKLPVRLEEQDAHELLVDLDRMEVESLRELGVEDGERRHWPADPQNVKTFIHTAMRYRPPASPALLPVKKDLAGSKVEISVQQRSRPGACDQLEVTFRNDSDLVIPLSAVFVEWEYSPPRDAPSAAGRPLVSETGGSVSLAPTDGNSQVQPRSERRFFLRDEMADVLGSVLADDVPPTGISVKAITPTGLGWVESGIEAAAIVRAVAQSVVSGWDT